MSRLINFKDFISQISDAYYRKTPIGTDFYTAISLGSVFGSTLASVIALKIYENGWENETVDIVEFGAASGALMKDVITYLRSSHSELCKNLRFCISEPKNELKTAQKQLLGEQINHINEDFKSPRAIIFANELLDALGFELILNGYFCDVSEDENGFNLVRSEIANEANISKRLNQTLNEIILSEAKSFENLDFFVPTDGELLLGCLEFLAHLKANFQEFVFLTFDYAAAASDRLSARVFYQHKAPILLTEAKLNALASADADITYTVAIDQILAFAKALGLSCKYKKQASWLLDFQAAQIALKQGRLAELKHLCFGLGENFCAFEIAYKKIL